MLSRSTKYALRALMCLAQDEERNFIKVEDLSKRARVPGPYLSKIIKALARCEIVLTRRGLQGGVRLHPDIKRLSFYEVSSALGDPVLSENCILSKTSCNASSPCSLHQRWSGLKKELHQFLKESRVV